MSVNPKDLIGIKKPPINLVPAAGVIETSMAMKNGALKYGPYNWRSHPVNLTVYIGAAQRHLLQLLDGEDIAEDSGVHHAGHVSACMAIILDALATGNLIDDRPVKGPASDLISAYTEGNNISRHTVEGDVSNPVVPVATTYNPITGAAPNDIPNVMGPDDNSTYGWTRMSPPRGPVSSDIK